MGSTNWGDWGSCYGRIAVAVIGGGNLWCKLGSLSKLRENSLRISTTNRTRLHGTNQDVRCGDGGVCLEWWWCNGGSLR